MAEYRLIIRSGPLRKPWPALQEYHGASRKRWDAFQLMLQRAIYEAAGSGQRDTRAGWEAYVWARDLTKDGAKRAKDVHHLDFFFTVEIH